MRVQHISDFPKNLPFVKEVTAKNIEALEILIKLQDAPYYIREHYREIHPTALIAVGA